VHSGYAAQPISHLRHLALGVKRPRGENDQSPPSIAEKMRGPIPKLPHVLMAYTDVYQLSSYADTKNIEHDKGIKAL
jgi:hypothetical protein